MSGADLSGAKGYFLADAAPELHVRLQALLGLRLVFFAGLPGTGKSLLSHQLAHLAHAAGREAHLLQWDVARPPFEASAAGQRYPQIDGATDPLIRRAVGLWARDRILSWDSKAHANALLVGETPLIGNRLIELTLPLDDTAEALLMSPSCRFVIPVPSGDVRRHIEAERERRAAAPRHAQEREDAPPHLLRDAWLEAVEAAIALGLATSTATEYDAALYEALYSRLLASRHRDVIKVEAVLPTQSLSVYEYAVPVRHLVPAAEEAERFIHVAEAMGSLGERLSPP
jgi:hypothetical protein